VVVVPVGEKDGVEAGEIAVERRGSKEMSDSPPQERIGEHAHAVELDVDRRVPDIADRSDWPMVARNNPKRTMTAVAPLR
jgi:hypothetical protein